MLEPYNVRGQPNLWLLVAFGGFAALLLGVAVFTMMAGADLATLTWWWGIASPFSFVFAMLALSFVMVRRGASSGTKKG